ncbi:MAG TPA: CDP-diacylglycerol--glycerol-3-phosphate 3-phosphatidyltransferase [Ktedonobacteraceae bacterium]|nr:CDP-diacylglycerol--glycerol-3-phosphate 3-phosphatidyltransferase [Ktedonobacteraceae bacterium]
MNNAPNLLSFSRIVATILVFVLVLINQPVTYLIATVVFFLASVTDLLDGYLARRYHLVSPLGIFLDLTADKVFVSAILIAYVQIALVPAWIVVIIVTREFLVTGLRSVASARGTVIPAGKLGKQKTFITLLAIGGILLAKGVGANHLSLYPIMLNFSSNLINVGDYLLLIADALMLLATIWTVLSGFEYLRGALPLLREKQDTAVSKV